MAIARFALLAFVAVNKGGGFGVEAVETIGLFVDKGIVLGNKLPPDFGRNDVLVDGGRGD